MSNSTSHRRSPVTFVEDLHSLVAANLAGKAEIMGRLRDLVQQAVKPAGPPGLVDPKTLVSRWLDFHLASYSLVSAHNLSLFNGLLSAAQQTFLGSAAPPSATARPAQIRLAGRSGERVTAPFLINNPHDRSFDVAFEVGPLCPANGTALPGSNVEFEPPRLTVPPLGQAVVHATVELTADFAVGQTYSTTLWVLGFETREVGLIVVVLPPSEAAPPAAEPQ